MKVLRKIAYLYPIFLVIVGCGSDTRYIPIYRKNPDQFPQKIISIFPKSEYGFVGDPMPYFEDGVMNMFYLYDGRDSQIGFHPYNLMTSTNFVDWTLNGTVIPFVNDESSQDLALGTGSIIKDTTGMYHAFYTGFNDRGQVAKKEKIQHATSFDKINWVKHPEDGFYGSYNDFRDPYVIYMEDYNEYWMLVTSRNVSDRGAILRYTSTDLINWTNQGTFLSNPDGNWNMECPTLIKFGDFWYLSYSKQVSGNDRIVIYRYTNDLQESNTNWITPPQNYFDGPGLYAGRLEKISDNRLVISGWVGTKKNEDYGQDYDWAGNLVTHELTQKSSGELFVKPTEEYASYINQEYNPTYFDISSGVIESEEKIEFTGIGYEYSIYEPLDANTTYKLSFQVTPLGSIDHFGFLFDVDSIYGNVKIELNHSLNEISLFFNNSTNPEQQSKLNFSFPEKNYAVTAMIENDILTLYIDNRIAFTSRIYSIKNRKWGIFSYNSNISIDNISWNKRDH
jgi:beta-fructofuranosidase